jgi:pimeloyl-ACP methyl ester carboxylesterase
VDIPNRPHFGIWQMTIQLANKIPGETIISDPMSGRGLTGIDLRHNDVLELIKSKIASVPCGVTDQEPIILVGYSRGGATVHAVAAQLAQEEPNIKIDLIVALGLVDYDTDDAGPVDYEVRPTNVTRYVHLRSEQGGNFNSSAGPNTNEGTRAMGGFPEEAVIRGVDIEQAIRDASHTELDDRQFNALCWSFESQNDPQRCEERTTDGVTAYIGRRIENEVWPIIAREIDMAVAASRNRR